MGSKKTFLFYDIETSGRSAAFDQILQFAAIRTDLELNEIARHELSIKLLPEIIPSPGALITHQIPISESLQGIAEVAAVQQIHQWVNTPGTISIGYNSLGFDDEFLRFAFYRNLLPAYTHQYANGCGRADLYPILLLYFLFKPDVLQWPVINGKSSLKLEHLSACNQLASGPAHRAITDVIATVELARRLMRDKVMWQYTLGYFDKQTAIERANKLSQITIGTTAFPIALYVDGQIGREQNFVCPVLGLGYHQHYKNQTVWLRLDRAELSSTTIADIAKTSWIIRKKMNEPGLLLPTQARYLNLLTKERQDRMAQNQTWLSNNIELLQQIANYHLNYQYPEIPNLDCEAALYQADFYTPEEQSICVRFHQASPSNKAQVIEQMANPQLRNLAIRLMARHYPDHLPSHYQAHYQAYLQKLNASDPAEALVDYRNQPRLTRYVALQQIAELRQAQNLTAKQLALLDELVDYLQPAF